MCCVMGGWKVLNINRASKLPLPLALVAHQPI